MTLCRFLIGDVLEQLGKVPDDSIDLVVTSPPFISLRDYLPAEHPDKAKEIGLERTPAEFIDALLMVVAALAPKLTRHASIAIELGDTYAGSGGAGGDYYNADGWRADQPKPAGSARAERVRDWKLDPSIGEYGRGKQMSGTGGAGWPRDKSAAMIPELFRVALAYGINPLTGETSPAGRWIVRNKVTWVRTNPPVGALGDKWRNATSDIVIATLSDNRYWDELATRVPASPNSHPRLGRNATAGQASTGKTAADERGGNWGSLNMALMSFTRPMYDWWNISVAGYKGAHFAVFPAEIPAPIIKAMCPHQVCTLCGQPRRPIIETTNSLGVASGRPSHVTQPDEIRTLDEFVDRNSNDVPTHADKVLLGWTHCACSVEPGPFIPRCTPTQFEMVSAPRLDDEGNPMINERTGKPKMVRRRVVSEIGHCAAPDAHHRRGVVLDPFGGSGTTGEVATGHGRDAILIDLDERNADLALERVGPLFFQLGM